jgi:hypothetical protein
MTNAQLELLLLRIAPPTIVLGVYVKRLTARGGDPAVAPAVAEELRRAEGAAGLVELTLPMTPPLSEGCAAQPVQRARRPTRAGFSH